MTDDIRVLTEGIEIDADFLETAFNVYDFLGLDPATLVGDQLLVPPIPWDEFWDLLAEHTKVLIGAHSTAAFVVTAAVEAYQRVANVQEVVE